MSSAPRPPPRGAGSAGGLELLVGGQGGGAELLQLPVDAIHPNPRQPRKRFEPDATAGLAASLRLQGVLQPVVVRPRSAGGYELIAGERRWRAAREAGLETLPAPLVRESDDREALLLGLVENVAARTSLPSRRRARTRYWSTSSSSRSERSRSASAGRSRASRTASVCSSCRRTSSGCSRGGELTEGHARAVLSIPDDDGRRRLARRVARDGLTVRATERAAQEGGAKRRPRAARVDPVLAERARDAAQRLTGLPARVSAGKLELHFGDETGLEELVEALEAL